jgi:DNA repair protein RadB
MARISLSTGSEDLNDFIHGYPLKGITVIYGEPATGKTTMALLASISQIKNNKKVIYIDTENSFSIDRLKQLFPDVENYMNNLIKIHPTSFEEQNSLINRLPIKNISLIVIDTIGFYYRTEKKENYKETNETLINQVEKLKAIAENKIPIIITNQVYQSIDTKEIKIVGGDILKHRADLLIKLKRTPRILTVEYPIKEKNKDYEENIETNKMYFEIKNEGIFKIEK